jgi:hypothetical protein
MSESIESYLDDVRAEAWGEHVYPRPAIDELAAPPLNGAFSRVSRVYERELRQTAKERVMTVRVADESIQAASKARDTAYQLLDKMPFGTRAQRYGLQTIIAELDKVLGPDLVREADSTGKALKALPFEERKRMLDALDSVQKVIDERGGGQPPMILVVEDEFPAILETAARKRGVHVVTERDAAAERMSDYLTQLGVDPDETFEGDSRTTAQILADVALSADGPVEVGSPEHQASERLTVALMAKSDVARGEGE